MQSRAPRGEDTPFYTPIWRYVCKLSSASHSRGCTLFHRHNSRARAVVAWRSVHWMWSGPEYVARAPGSARQGAVLGAGWESMHRVSSTDRLVVPSETLAEIS
jgi:hypothetical protein